LSEDLKNLGCNIGFDNVSLFFSSSHDCNDKEVYMCETLQGNGEPYNASKNLNQRLFEDGENVLVVVEYNEEIFKDNISEKGY
jgi:hypothetical protein